LWGLTGGERWRYLRNNALGSRRWSARRTTSRSAASKCLRLCANFRSKLGQSAGTTEEELEDDAKKVIDKLRESFRLLTDGIAKNRTLPKKEGFVGDELITDYTELMLVSQYFELQRVEKMQFGQLELALQEFPIYTTWLSKQRGIGPAMAAVIISEIDISKARYVSSLWAFAGLDVVTHWELTGSAWLRRKVGGTAKQPEIPYEPVVPALLLDADGGNGPVVIDGRTHSVSYHANAETRERHGLLTIEENGWALQLDYKEVHTGGRSRKKHHLVRRKYIDKNGEEQERDSITFSPFLRTKLLGVVGISFLRSGSDWRDHYDRYKFRLESDPARRPWSAELAKEITAAGGNPSLELWRKGRIHASSIRYMVKMLLLELYAQWRPLEGLPVHRPYHEAKLGHVHGGDDDATEAA
jgi:hypothetical protein